jgi:hypothetical protein
LKADRSISRKSLSVGAVALLGFIGAWARLAQYPHQILQDDEWHAVHKLLEAGSLGDLFLDLGVADYSIPLSMLYWLQLQWFGLSELALRWPMLLAGLFTLALFTAYAWDRFSPRVALVFCFLLAFSPMLVIYSHMARPYALTLFLSVLSIYAFYRYLEGRGRALGWGIAYVAGAGLSIWVHIVTAPLVAAPLLLECVRPLATRRPVPWLRLAGVAVPVALLTALLLGPPMIANPQALAIKTGETSITAASLTGAVFLWAGTPQAALVIALLVLSACGGPRMLRGRPVIQGVLSGLGLTLALILASRPAYSNHSLTLARYLLAALPLLMLSAACGIDLLLQRYRRLQWPLMAALLLLAGAYLSVSPLRDVLRRPNSSMTHLAFLFDFRESHNDHARFLEENLPLSDFWVELGRLPRESLRVAVAPYYFESFSWNGPRWEAVGRQRIVPAYLQGFCAPQRHGEVPRDSKFRFRNAFYLSSLGEEQAVAPDWLVFNRPYAWFEQSATGRRENRRSRTCLQQLEQVLGPPDYEDGVLVAYRLGPGADG